MTDCATAKNWRQRGLSSDSHNHRVLAGSHHKEPLVSPKRHRVQLATRCGFSRNPGKTGVWGHFSRHSAPQNRRRAQANFSSSPSNSINSIVVVSNGRRRAPLQTLSCRGDPRLSCRRPREERKNVPWEPSSVSKEEDLLRVLGLMIVTCAQKGLRTERSLFPAAYASLRITQKSKRCASW